MPSIPEPVGHEIHRPDLVRGLRHRQFVRFLPLQTLARFDPQVQFELAVDAGDPLVVPLVPLDVT